MFVLELRLAIPAALQAAAMLLPFLSITSINRGFVTIGSAAKFFLGISFLLQAVLSHSA